MFLFLAVLAFSADYPEPTSLFIFNTMDYGSKYYRIPAICRTNDGTIICACDMRHDSNADLAEPIQIIIRRSLDDGVVTLGTTRVKNNFSRFDATQRGDLRPGDLVFFNGRSVNKRIGHVGIVTEVDSTGDGFRFIHASTSQGVCVSKSDDAYYSRRYMGACRPIKK